MVQATFRSTICESTLGKSTKIDSLEIHWPSGQTETLTDLQVDKFYSVLEGQGIVSREKIALPKKPAKP